MNSNYQIGQATHREYEVRYGQNMVNETATNKATGLMKWASVLGTVIGTVSALWPMVA